jgi:hypothetical protein
MTGDGVHKSDRAARFTEVALAVAGLALIGSAIATDEV